jgi:hypothetical protein
MSFYLIHSADHPHVQRSRGRKGQTIVVRWKNDPLCQNTQCRRLIPDAHPTVWSFNNSVSPNHFSPICFPRINVNIPFIMFLLLAASSFLSSKLYQTCYISGSHSGASEDSSLLGCESLSISERLPTFRTTAVLHFRVLRCKETNG